MAVKRITHGILSIGSSVLFVPMYLVIFYMTITDTIEPVQGNEYVLMILLMVLWVANIVTILCLMITYMINAFKNKRITWGICLYFFNVFIIPVYWYKYMYRKSQGEYNG